MLPSLGPKLFVARAHLRLLIVPHVGKAEIGQVQIIRDDRRNDQLLLATKEPENGATGLNLGRPLYE